MGPRTKKNSKYRLKLEKSTVDPILLGFAGNPPIITYIDATKVNYKIFTGVASHMQLLIDVASFLICKIKNKKINIKIVHNFKILHVNH